MRAARTSTAGGGEESGAGLVAGAVVGAEGQGRGQGTGAKGVERWG